ncbi:MAG: sigma-70 family RNA polymerase sigma factor [Deltaproteobacteria bacterium]|nr:sigma-70 family RNA polymerase sigma factor [Deltaproteobacteria bacterium]
MSTGSELAAELQAQSHWLRALARSLVGDARADDLVQDTYAQALSHPPETDRPLRPWLRRVAINVARMGWRSDQRRRARELEAASLSAVAKVGANDAVARAELSRDLVDAVLALDEPYRQTVLLRFVDDLSAAEIARRQRIPAATVRSRLKRGLDHLRVELDRRHGDRSSWQRALLPLAVPTTAKGAALASGVLIVKLTVASIAAASIAALAIVAWPDDDPPRAESLATVPAGDPPSTRTPRSMDQSREPSAARRQLKRFRSMSERERFAASLAAVRRRRDRYRRPSSATSSAPPPSLPAPTLDREYIQDRIRDVLPLIKECYELALDEQPDARLEGKLLVNFTIDAEQEVGGYVAEASLAEPNSAISKAIGECVTETIYSIEFVPPEGGGQMKVSYPFVFTSE